MLECPSMLRVRQKFPPPPKLELVAEVRAQLAAMTPRLVRGSEIAVGVGSRGISNLQLIVRTVVDVLREAGVKPFIVPAMGSHGGATPDGQITLLGEYGVSEAALGVSIRAGMEVEQLGQTPQGYSVAFSAEALRANGIIIINRIKPHTDFGGLLGSGLLKMLVVGLGKRTGAANFHIGSSQLGYENVLRASAHVILGSKAPVIGGLGVVEDQAHRTVQLKWLNAAELEAGEEKLFEQAKRLMPRLPFEEIDLLIVDRIGKNISGSGMDPNVTGRGVHGYSSALGDRNRRPNIKRLFVRELTPESHGNGIGIGNADFTTSRFVRSMDARITAINSITALTVQGAKVPIHFETDREVIGFALTSLGLSDARDAKVVRIADTLSLEELDISTAYQKEVAGRADLEVVAAPRGVSFDGGGNLPPLGQSA